MPQRYWKFDNGNKSTPDNRTTTYLLQDTGRTSKYDLQGSGFDGGMRCFVIQSHLFWVLSWPHVAFQGASAPSTSRQSPDQGRILTHRTQACRSFISRRCSPLSATGHLATDSQHDVDYSEMRVLNWFISSYGNYPFRELLSRSLNLRFDILPILAEKTASLFGLLSVVREIVVSVGFREYLRNKLVLKELWGQLRRWIMC